MTGTEWRVIHVDETRSGRRRGDGDTVYLIRTGRARLGDDEFYLTDVEPKSIRLVWVDTPEAGEPGHRKAADDLTAWIEAAGAPNLRVVCYESAGWDRLLGDLIDFDGNSASQWLMIEKGWPPYDGGAR